MVLITFFLSLLICLWYAHEQNAGMRVKMTMATIITEKTNGPGVHLGNVSYGVSVSFVAESQSLRVEVKSCIGGSFLQEFMTCVNV